MFIDAITHFSLVSDQFICTPARLKMRNVAALAARKMSTRIPAMSHTATLKFGRIRCVELLSISPTMIPIPQYMLSLLGWKPFVHSPRKAMAGVENLHSEEFF